MSDNISDMITRIRNAQRVGLLSTNSSFSNYKLSILKVLKSKRYISNYSVSEDGSLITIFLSYTSFGVPAITKIDKVSKPGKRFYSSAKDLKPYYNGFGLQVISTSKGVVSDSFARKNNLGGEVICKVF